MIDDNIFEGDVVTDNPQDRVLCCCVIAWFSIEYYVFDDLAISFEGLVWCHFCESGANISIIRESDSISSLEEGNASKC